MDWLSSDIDRLMMVPTYKCTRFLYITQGMVKMPCVDAINYIYATKCTTKMKAKFSYCDQIKSNEHVLRTPEW